MQAFLIELWMWFAGFFVLGMFLVAWLGRIHMKSRLSRADKNWGTRIRAAEDGANTRLRAVEQSYTEQLEQGANRLNAITTDLQSQKARVSSLSDEVSKWRTDFQELQEEHETTVARLRTLDERLAVALEDADQLDLERKRLRGELERRGSELTRSMEEAAQLPGLRTNLKALEEVVAKREARIRELEPLEDEVREIREQLQLMRHQHASDLTRRDDEATRLRSRVGELEPMAARVEVLTGQLAEKTATLTSLESQLAALNGFPDRLRDNERELAQAREGSRELEADLARLRGELDRERRLAKLNRRDDLKKISGIGPKLESRLHGLGYRTYKQIASWSQEDIDRVEHHLPEFPNRIERDDWIGQARRLQAQDNGDDAIV